MERKFFADFKISGASFSLMLMAVNQKMTSP